jgi:hypothetical protein
MDKSKNYDALEARLLPDDNGIRVDLPMFIGEGNNDAAMEFVVHRLYAAASNHPYLNIEFAWALGSDKRPGRLIIMCKRPLGYYWVGDVIATALRDFKPKII